MLHQVFKKDDLIIILINLIILTTYQKLRLINLIILITNQNLKWKNNGLRIEIRFENRLTIKILRFFVNFWIREIAFSFN